MVKAHLGFRGLWDPLTEGTPPEQQQCWQGGKRQCSTCLVLTAAACLQVALPVGAVEGMPVGLGLIGPPGSDEVLLDLSVRLAEVLGINRS